MTLTDIPFEKMDGTTGTLADYAGDVVLVVNVASKCGLTPQYEGLQKLYTEKSGDGLTILGFPANNFGGQEPGTDEEIATFCSTNYDVTFPVLSKISVLGEDQHPLYAELTQAIPTTEGKEPFRERMRASGNTPTEDPDVLWNFEKFLIAKDGHVAARFAPMVTPDDPALSAAIANELAK
ncbi:MAG TPA: glutathione peroxidase [Thermomicrobiales bacterium]|nr:glutathione peroxidase [Thermomicrobiales bacterium]